jgi:hypothetical protein
MKISSYNRFAFKNKTSTMKNVGKIIFAIVVALVIAVGAFVFTKAYKESETTVVFTVNDKDRVSYGSGSDLTHKYLIYTNRGTYECTDSIFGNKFNSSDIYGRIKRDKRYRARVIGWRNHYMSSYQNILSISAIE